MVPVWHVQTVKLVDEPKYAESQVRSGASPTVAEYAPALHSEQADAPTRP